MRRGALFALFVVLVLVFASFAVSAVFAAESPDAAESGQKAAEVMKFGKSDLVNLIVVYCLFGVSLVVGIPALRALNRRKKAGYVDVLARDVSAVAERMRSLAENGGTPGAKRDNLRYSLKIAAVADTALTAYSENQLDGCYEIYNGLNDLKTRLADAEGISEKEKRDAEYASLISEAAALAEKAGSIAENESKIRRYNR